MNDAVQVVNFLLETSLIRVCAGCEQEFGPVATEPGTRKSHGYCRRHAIQYYREAGLEEEVPRLQREPEERFCPDLSLRHQP